MILYTFLSYFANIKYIPLTKHPFHYIIYVIMTIFKKENYAMKAAEAVAKCLKKENITTVFGYPGAAICAVYEAIEKEGIKHILVRHEQNAGHAANGYARVNNTPAVCIATSGPGATNLLTAIATAYMDSIPVVFITGQVSSDQIGRDVFQEADITGASEPFIKHSFLVKDAASIPKIFKEAFILAGTGRKGPVLIDIPEDIAEEEIDFNYPEKLSIRGYKPTTKGNKLQLKRCAEAIAESERPLICAGGGVLLSGATEELYALSEKISAPIVTTMMGIGSFPTEDERNLGMIGRFGKEEANIAVNKCDLILFVGARVGDRAVKSPTFIEKTTKIIHIDIDPAEIGKNLTSDIPVVGDVKNILSALSDVVSERNVPLWKTKKEDNSDKTLAAKLVKRVSEKLTEGGVFVSDVGNHLITAANNVSLQKGVRFFTSGGMGTMGYALPASIGAYLASGKDTVAFIGDGAFQMSLQELATVKQNNIPVKIIIADNTSLGMVRDYQKAKDLKEFAVSLDGSPDYLKLADAYGIKSALVDEESDIDEMIDSFLSAKEPFIILCRTE